MSEQLKGVLTGIKLTHRHRFNSLNLTKPRVSWWFHLSIKTKTHQTKQQKNISLSQFCEWNIDSTDFIPTVIQNRFNKGYSLYSNQ